MNDPSKQTIYNVRVAVVELISATDDSEAVDILRGRLIAAGFDPYDCDPGDAFESEPLLTVVTGDGDTR